MSSEGDVIDCAEDDCYCLSEGCVSFGVVIVRFLDFCWYELLDNLDE